MRYFIFLFCAKSLKFDMYFTCLAHFNSDEPLFDCCCWEHEVGGNLLGLEWGSECWGEEQGGRAIDGDVSCSLLPLFHSYSAKLSMAVPGYLPNFQFWILTHLSWAKSDIRVWSIWIKSLTMVWPQWSYLTFVLHWFPCL